VVPGHGITAAGNGQQRRYENDGQSRNNPAGTHSIEPCGTRRPQETHLRTCSSTIQDENKKFVFTIVHEKTGTRNRAGATRFAKS